MRIVKLTEQERAGILENLLKRSPNQYGKYEDTVQEILDDVKEKKDQALFDYTKSLTGQRLQKRRFL